MQRQSNATMKMSDADVRQLLKPRRRWSWEKCIPLKVIMWLLAMVPPAILALWLTGLIDPAAPW